MFQCERLARMDRPDKELLARYRRGDVDALETLVHRYRQPLYGFIAGMTQNRTEADDVFQEVWLKAIRKIGGYRHRSFCGWLVRIARNTVIDRARKKRPDVSLDEQRDDGVSLLELVPSGEPDARRRAEAGEAGEQIRRAVAELPAVQREVFMLRTQMELPFREIARLQGVPLGTALARMQYALVKLREKLAPGKGAGR